MSQDFVKCSQIITVSVRASFRWRVLQNISILLLRTGFSLGSGIDFAFWDYSYEIFITKSVSSATHREKCQIWATPQEKLTNLGHTPKKNVKFISLKIK